MSHKKEYSIYKILMESPRTWLNIMDLACEVNLTYRQAAKFCAMMPAPVETRVSPYTDMLQVRVNTDDETTRKLHRAIVEDIFDITPEMEDKVMTVLDTDEGVTLAYLVKTTGLKRSDVLKILSIMNVDRFRSDQHQVYRSKRM